MNNNLYNKHTKHKYTRCVPLKIFYMIRAMRLTVTNLSVYSNIANN